MKRIGYSISVLVYLFILLIVGCTQNQMIQEPDVERFNQTVHSPALRDSLLAGKLTPGMPRFVASQLFEDWTTSDMEIKIPVASLGSKQRLEEVEGWARVYVDPNTEVLLDIYETEKGELYVWYQRPNFYTMDVSRRDTLCIFLEDTIVCSVIECLNKIDVLTLRDSVPIAASGENIYAEVRYNDNPRRTVSYWYAGKIFSNDRRFKIKAANYETYPIEVLELNGEPVPSFKWR